jgi:alpha-L-fucosidase
MSTGGVLPSNGGSTAGGTTSQGGTNPSGGTVGSGSSAGSGSSGGSAPTGGKAGTGGTTGGNGPTGGSLGTTGGASSGGTSTGGTSTGGKATGGSGPVVELAKGKPTTAKTVQAANPASNGNDGVDTTRFCAANGNTGNWWRVDLGAVHALTRVEVMWEFARQYNYLVEISSDDESYTTVVDRSTTTDSAQTQTLPFSATARYVRITATALPTTPPTWMSFFEVKVYGM